MSAVNPAARTRRFRARGAALAAAAAAGAAVSLTAAACSSGPGPSPTPQPTSSPRLYGLAIAQCAIDRGLIPAKYLQAGNGESRWLRGGRITANGYFSDWWNEEMTQITIAGKTLEDWELGAEQQRRLPAQICGNSAAPGPGSTAHS